MSPAFCTLLLSRVPAGFSRENLACDITKQGMQRQIGEFSSHQSKRDLQKLKSLLFFSLMIFLLKNRNYILFKSINGNIQ
ncbi:hypothetical protein Cadr_000031131 [Camelus dromedarius]|uniref:Uncharacterized protein n=1 Tax=Camelus dromedarius TaxID=9838 RepID=A0A5N4BXD5_CAMDR|nr:hypothetical protein Cadr_000031131 [Camelus dromedarius]